MVNLIFYIHLHSYSHEEMQQHAKTVPCAGSGCVRQQIGRALWHAVDGGVGCRHPGALVPPSRDGNWVGTVTAQMLPSRAGPAHVPNATQAGSVNQFLLQLPHAACGTSISCAIDAC